MKTVIPDRPGEPKRLTATGPVSLVVLVLLSPCIVLCLAAYYAVGLACWGLYAGAGAARRGLVALWRRRALVSWREAQATGWDPNRGREGGNPGGQRWLVRAGRLRQVGWASVPLWSIGTLAFAPFLFVALARRRARDWAVCGGYLAAVALAVVLAHATRTKPGFWLLSVGLVAAVHVAVVLRPDRAWVSASKVQAAEAKAQTAAAAKGRAAGWDPERALIHMRQIRQIKWASVPVWSFGFLAFAPFLFIALVRRRAWDWAVSAVYFGADALLIVLLTRPDVSGPGLLLLGLVAAAHTLIEFRPGSALAASRDVYLTGAAYQDQLSRTVLAWNGTDMLLGRGAENPRPFADDPAVAERHAMLRRTPDGACVAEDLRSDGGTFVNGERIEGPARLKPGDELRLGTTRLRVCSPGGSSVRVRVRVPGALRVDHVYLKMMHPRFRIAEGQPQAGWLALTDAGEIRFYRRRPTAMTKPPAFRTPSPEEFTRKIGATAVWGWFGDKKCYVQFTGEPDPERVETEEKIGDLGDSVAELGDSLSDAFPSADFGTLGAEGDVMALGARIVLLVRWVRNRKRRAAARNAWYPVLLGRRSWFMINAVPGPGELVLEIPQVRPGAGWTSEQVGVPVRTTP